MKITTGLAEMFDRGGLIWSEGGGWKKQSIFYKLNLFEANIRRQKITGLAGICYLHQLSRNIVI